MLYMHEIEMTERAAFPSWETVIRGEKPEEYAGSAEEYGREVMQNWITEAGWRGELRENYIDADGNALLRVRVESEDGENLAVVEVSEFHESLIPAVVWGVIRDEARMAHVVDPGVAGIMIPDSILEWAAGHGYNVDDPDVWIGVTFLQGAFRDDQWALEYHHGRINQEEARLLQEALDNL